MDQTGSSEELQPAWTALAHSKKGALGRFWEKHDAGLIGVENEPTVETSPPVITGLAATENQLHEPPQHQLPMSTSPITHRQTYGRRLLPPRQPEPMSPTTPRTPRPSSQLPEANDYVPQFVSPSGFNRAIRTTSLSCDPRPAPIHSDAVPLDDDTFMMNVSPLFRNGSYGLGGRPNGDQHIAMEDGSPSQQAPRVSPTISRPSVDRPSPRSQPYPHVAPDREYVIGETFAGDSSGVTDEDSHKILIKPRSNHFDPAKHGIDIGFDCIAKHWVAGWTTIQYCDHEAKENWFEEFKAKARWDAKNTPEIRRIFFAKCRTKLNNGWYNLRHERTAEGLRFLKRHEVEKGLLWYLDNSELIHTISERNKINSKAIEARIHRGGPKGTDVHYDEMENASLGKIIYCLDMYDRLKKIPNGTYLSDAAAEKAGLLQEAHNALKRDYKDSVPQALDFEVGSQILGLNKRTKLPKYIGTAAILVKESKFQRLGSQHTHSSSPSTGPQLDAIVQQMTQLQEMMQQQQQVITDLAQALLRAQSSQPPRPEEDEDMELSSD